MMKKNIQKQNGYAILFAVIMIGIILSISIGLSDIAYKQLIVSSVANDSQQAFYESDTATECALYSDFIKSDFSSSSPAPTPPSTIACGVDKNGNPENLNVAESTSPDGTSNVYDLTPPDDTSLNPCFTISASKNTTTGTTLIAAKGYNICNKTNPQTVEREIDASY